MGLVTPALIISIAGAIIYYRRKNAALDHTGTEWKEEDEEGESVNVYDDLNHDSLGPLGDFNNSSAELGLKKGQTMNSAVNF